MLNRAFVTALAEKCPYYQVPLADCSLAKLRDEGEVEKLKERLEKLSDKEIDDIIRGHFLCACRRDGCEI